MTPAIALELWRRALSREIGIILTLKDPSTKKRVESLLYEARKNAADPRLEVLSLVFPGDKPEEIWIIRKTTDLKDINASTPFPNKTQGNP